MFDPAKFAMQMIQNNPQVMNNPMAKQYLEIIQNGDSAKGQEVANNILKTYGMTKDQAMEAVSEETEKRGRQVLEVEVRTLKIKRSTNSKDV